MFYHVRSELFRAGQATHFLLRDKQQLDNLLGRNTTTWNILVPIGAATTCLATTRQRDIFLQIYKGAWLADIPSLQHAVCPLYQVLYALTLKIEFSKNPRMLPFTNVCT